MEYPAPRAGEMIKIDAGVAGETMEVVCRFPGGLDFGRGLVDVNVTSHPCVGHFANMLSQVHDVAVVPMSEP